MSKTVQSSGKIHRVFHCLKLSLLSCKEDQKYTLTILSMTGHLSKSQHAKVEHTDDQIRFATKNLSQITQSYVKHLNSPFTNRHFTDSSKRKIKKKALILIGKAFQYKTGHSRTRWSQGCMFLTTRMAYGQYSKKI